MTNLFPVIEPQWEAVARYARWCHMHRSSWSVICHLVKVTEVYWTLFWFWESRDMSVFPCTHLSAGLGSRHSVQYAWGGETVASDILSGKSFTSWRDQAKGANKPRVDWKVLLWYNYVYDIKESIWKATWSCKTAVTLGHIQPHVNTGIQHFWKRKPARYYAKPCTAKLS